MVSLSQPKARKSGSGNISTLKRKAMELQIVNDNTEQYITGKVDDNVVSLQEIKDTLKSLKGNPHGMHLEKGHANAQIRSDMQYLVRKGIHDTEGKPHKVKAKELGNRVIFINAQLARELIAKAPKKQQEDMKERFQKVMQLPDRKTY
jgi:hypothetical protein